MIDTLQLQLSKDHYTDDQITQLLQNKLNPKHMIIYDGEGYSQKATYKNWNFHVSNYFFKGIGSLTSLQFGHNITNASHDDIRASLDHLQSVLNVPINDAVIKRLDVGYNIPMNYPVAQYLKLLIRPEHFEDAKYGDDTIYFKNNAGIITFYDKGKEASKKKGAPAEIKKLNLLRYELRLKTGMLKKVGLPDLTVGHLYDRNVYLRLAEAWLEYYHKIPKLTDPTPLKINFNSVSGFKDSLAIYAINDAGGIENVRAMLPTGTKNAKVRSDLRKCLNKLEYVTALSPIIQEELDAKVEAAYECMINAA